MMNHHSSRPKRRENNASFEPSNQEMVEFQGMLRVGHDAAVAAHRAFKETNDEKQFFRDIISLCRSSALSEESISGGSSQVRPNLTSLTSENKQKKYNEVKKPPEKKATKKDDTGTSSTKKSSQIKPVCTFFSKQGCCRKGKKCRFLHPEGFLSDGHWLFPPNERHMHQKPQRGHDIDAVQNSESSSQRQMGTQRKATPDHCDSLSATSIPRSSSVENAMGLMDMDMKYLEENLDMRLEDKSPTSLEEAHLPDQEYSKLFLDLISGQPENNCELNENELTWMNVNNSEQTQSTPHSLVASAVANNASSSSDENMNSPSLDSLQSFSSLLAQDKPTGHCNGSGGDPETRKFIQTNSMFNEVVNDVIDVACSSTNEQHRHSHAPQNIEQPSPPQTKGIASVGISQQINHSGTNLPEELRENNLHQYHLHQQHQATQHHGFCGPSPYGFSPNVPFPPPYMSPPAMIPMQAAMYHHPPLHPPPVYGYAPGHSRQVFQPDKHSSVDDPVQSSGHSSPQHISASPETFKNQLTESGDGFMNRSSHPTHVGPMQAQFPYQFVPPPRPMYPYGPPQGGFLPPAMIPPGIHQYHHHQEQQQLLPPQQQHRQEQHQNVMHHNMQHQDSGQQVSSLNQGRDNESNSSSIKAHVREMPPDQTVANSSHQLESNHSSTADGHHSFFSSEPVSMEDKFAGDKSQKLLSFLKSNSSPSLPSVPKKKNANGNSASTELNETCDETIALEKESINAKKTEYFRTTKFSGGCIRISKPAAGAMLAHNTRHATYPAGPLFLSWDITHTVVRDSPDAQFVIALTRLGTAQNSNNIVAKPLKPRKPLNNNQCMSGTIFFHAPKAAGYYVFRMYDRANEERQSRTLATSPVFAVELRGQDVTTNLSFIFNSFVTAKNDSKVDNGAINGLKNVFELMRTTGAIVKTEKPPQQLLQDCVRLLLDSMFEQMSLFDLQSELLAAQHAAGDDADAKATVATSETWQKIRTAQRVHMSAYDCLVALRSNTIAMGMLSGEQRAGVNKVLGLYSPLLGRFYRTFSELQEACSREIGIVPAPLDPTFQMLCVPSNSHAKRARTVLQALSRDVMEASKYLMPPKSFDSDRERIRKRIQNYICSSGVVPPNCSVMLFGSSKNNFGAAGADLDMCLLYPKGEKVPMGEDRGPVIEKLGEVMLAHGMLEVQARSTARIPILLFKDCESGIDCDISFNNPLAICNTKLLAAYSAIDERVRILAFAIKHWAKRREINSPQNGTLSSYGYLLCLIHFLQSRGVVPDLQSLPPNWDPQKAAMDAPPIQIENHPVEGCPCNTYFYDPNKIVGGLQKLKKFCSSNKQTVGELFVDFFRYFAHDFDYRRDIVSIRRPQGSSHATKLSKMEYSCWGSHERLSVEDPFEVWYDVAHVLKSAQMTYIRAEFLRAYTLMYNAAIGECSNERSLLEQLCTPPTETPKFILRQQQQLAERRSRSNTATSDI